MVAKKEDDKKVKIKATTGAWWKSANAENTETTETKKDLPVGTAQEAEPTKKAKASAKPKAPAKPRQRVRKPASKAPVKKATTKAKEDSEVRESEKEQEVTAKPKAPAKPRQRTRKPASSTAAKATKTTKAKANAESGVKETEADQEVVVKPKTPAKPRQRVRKPASPAAAKTTKAKTTKTAKEESGESEPGTEQEVTPKPKAPAKPRQRARKPASRTPAKKAQAKVEEVADGESPEKEQIALVTTPVDESPVKTPKKAAAPKKKPAPAKRKPRAKATPKEIDPGEEIAANEQMATSEEQAQGSVESQDPPKPQKSTRGRRKKPAKAEKPVVEDLQETEQIAEDVEVQEALESPTTPEESETPSDAQLDADEEKASAKNEKQVKRADKPQQPVAADQEEVAEPVEQTKKVCKLLINAEEPEECRLALLEDGRLESIHVSTISKEQRKNNIYKAKIVALEPSLQAAFVDYGTDKNGFLPFGEIHPEYYRQDLSPEIQKLVDNNHWKKLKITDVLEKGQDILAQVVKEEIGKKGANMTTYLSIPGRCVVLMPGSDSAGISRKISGEQRRSQLRETMKSMDLPDGVGWIVRTASVDITHTALSRDVDYLTKLWEDIKGKGQETEGVGLVYEDHESVSRFLREHYDPSIQEILVDDRVALEQVKDFVKMLPKEQQSVKVRLHQGARPIFNQYSVEDQIESIYQPHVNLPSGGSIVIDPTEALVAIDVNSGSTSKGRNFEASIFQANMEAAEELARQLRLRDLGGLVVVDFIDMRSKKNIIAVERQVKSAMKKDKAKVDFTRISKFGLMQISRQKLGAPIEAGNYRRCDHCKGRGSVRSIETLSLFYLRRVQTGASRKPVERVECHFPLDVASYLLNNKRSEINEMEKRYHVEITIVAETSMKPADNSIVFHKVEKDTNNKKQA